MTTRLEMGACSYYKHFDFGFQSCYQIKAKIVYEIKNNMYSLSIKFCTRALFLNNNNE